MKKLTIVLLTVMMWFNTLTVNVLADDGQNIDESVVGDSTNEVLETPESGEFFDDEEDEVIIEETIEDEDIDDDISSEIIDDDVNVDDNSIPSNIAIENNNDNNEDKNVIDSVTAEPEPVVNAEIDYSLYVDDTITENIISSNVYNKSYTNIKVTYGQNLSGSSSIIDVSAKDTSKINYHSIQITLKALSAGDETFTISYTYNGSNSSITKTVHVSNPAPAPEKNSNLTYNGLGQQLVTFNNNLDLGYEFYIASKDYSKDENTFNYYLGRGNITFSNDISTITKIDAGTYYVYWRTTKEANGYSITDAQYNRLVTVSIAKADLTADNIVFNPTNAEYSYTSNTVTPSYKVMIGDTEIDNSNWSVCRSNGKTSGSGGTSSTNSATNVGEYHIYFNGKGNFNDKGNTPVDKTWKIVKDYNLANAAKVTLTKKEFDFTDSEINVINNNGFKVEAYGATLTQGVDYEIETNSNIGKAISDYTLVINGLGDWVGSSITIPWKITKLTPVVNAKANLTYNGSGQELISIGATSEELIYSFYVSDSKINNQNTLDNATFDSNIPSRTDAGTYYVYWEASGNDSYKEMPRSTSNYISVAIAQVNVNNIHIKVKGDIDSTNQYIYINENITPVFVGDYGQLGPNDYTLPNGSSKKSIGTYSVKVTGNKNYTGNITLEWKIVGNNDLSHATVDFDPANDYYYNGQNQTVKAEDFVIKYDTTTLTPNVDFEIINGADGSTGKNASSSYLVTISGKGDYINSIQKTWTINKVDPDVYFVNETNKEKSGELFYTGEEQTLVKNSTSEDVKYGYYISQIKYDNNTVGKVAFATLVKGLAANAWTEDFNDVTKKEPGTYYVYWKANGNNNYNEIEAAVTKVVSVTIKAVPNNPNIVFVSNPTDKSTAKFTFKDNKYGLVIDPNSGYVVDKLTLVEGENEPRTIELVRDEDGNYITSEYIELNTEIKNTFTAELRVETDADKATKVELLTGGLTGTALKQKLNYLYSGRTFRVKAKDADVSTAYEINSSNAANTIDVDGSDFEFVDGVVYQYQYSTRKDSVNYNNTWFDFVVNHYFATETEVVNGENNDVSFKQRISGTTTQEITDKLYTQYDTEITVNDIPYMEYVVKAGDGDSTTTLTSDNNVFVIKGNSNYKDSKYVELPDVSKLSVIYSFNNKIVLNNGEHGKLTYNIGRVDSSISFTATPDDFYEVGKFTLTVHDNNEGTDDVYYLTSEDYSEELNGVYSTNDLQTLIDLDADNKYTITAEYSIKTIESVDSNNIFIVPVLYKNNVASLWKTVFTDVFKISLINNTGIEIESIDGDKYDINPHISLANLGLINITEGTVYRYRTYKQTTNLSRKEDYSYWTYFAVHYYTQLIPVIQEQGVLDLSNKYSSYIDYAQIDADGNEITIVDGKILSEYDTVVKVKDVIYMRPVVTFSNISTINSPATRGAKNDNVTTYVISKNNYNSSNLLSSIEDATLTVTVNYVESFDSFLDIKDNDYGTIVPTKDNDNIIFTVTPAVGYKVTGLTYKEIEKPATLSDLLDKEDSEKVEESIASTSELEQLKEVVEEEVEDVTPVSIELTFNEGNGVAKSKGTKFYENKYYVIEATIEPELILVDNPVAKAYKDYEGNMHVPTEEELFSAMVDTENCDTEQSKVEIKYFCLTSDNYATNSEDLFAWQDLDFKKSTITDISELFGRTYHEFGEGYRTDEDDNAVEMIRFYINGIVNKELSTKAFYKEITLKDTRTPVVISSDSSSFSFTYTEGLKEALSNEIYGRIIAKNGDNPEELITEGISIDDFDIQGLPENASILSRKITVVFKGNSEYKPTEDNVLSFNVRVNRAISNLDVHADNRDYNGEQIELSVTANPANVAKAYIISGIDANLEGFVSVQIDTDKMVYEVPDTSAEIENLIRQILNNESLTIPDSIRTLLDAYVRIDDVANSGINDIIAWINERAGRELIPTSTTTKQKIIEQLVNALLPESLKGIYKDGKIYYGDAIVNLINVAITTRDTVQLSAYINELNSFLTKLNVNNEQLTNLLENVEKALETIEGANTTKIYLNKGVTPTNAGIYSIFGSTIDRNYYPELTVDTFTIRAHFDGKITWNKSFTEVPINLVYNEDQTKVDEYFAATYSHTNPDMVVDEDGKNGKVRYLYFGGSVLTEDDIKNFNGIEDVLKLADKATYLGENAPKQAGIYTQLAYTTGNYISAKVRVFTIKRVDTKFKLDNINCVYGDSTYADLANKFNVDADGNAYAYVYANVSEEEFAELKAINAINDEGQILDSEGKPVVEPINFTGFKLNRDALNIFTADRTSSIYYSKKVPTEAGAYDMVVGFLGSELYQPAAQITKLLTITPAKVDIDWNYDNDKLTVVDLLGKAVTYKYEGQVSEEDFVADKIVATTANQELFNSDGIGIDVKNYNPNVGLHVTGFELTGEKKNNYYIGISDLALSYTITPARIDIKWKEEAGTVGPLGNILTYEYCGKETLDEFKKNKLDITYPDVFDEFEDDYDPINVIGFDPNAGVHVLGFSLDKDAQKNYYIDLHDLVLETYVTPRPIEVYWDRPTFKDDYRIIRGTLTYEYNGKIFYLTDYQGNDKFSYKYAGLKKGQSQAILDGDNVRVDISSGLDIHTGKHTANFSLFGREDSKNYVIVKGEKLPYEIKPKVISVVYDDDIENVDRRGVLHYVYDGTRQFPTNRDLELEGVIGTDNVYPVITADIANMITVYNSIDANATPRKLNITLLGNSAKDYVLDTSSIKYVIDQRPVSVVWTVTSFNYDGTRKSPEYVIDNIVEKDAKNTFVYLAYNVYDGRRLMGAPKDVGTYEATVIGINNKNYKLISPFRYDSKTIFNICDEETVYGDLITIGSVTDPELKEQGATSIVTNIPDRAQGVALLDNLDNKDLLNAFTNENVDRILHLNLESSPVDIYADDYTEQRQLAENRIGVSTVKKAFFFDLDLFADVTGVTRREQVHETNSNYEVAITITISKDCDVARNIIGRNKQYHVIRIHNGVLSFINVKVSEDADNYYFSFMSDKFSTYGIYSTNIAPYIAPKTGIR